MEQVSLFDRRLIFVSGKGGAGKTTTAAALAMACSRLGKKVLLAEVWETNAIGPLFDQGPLTATPTLIKPYIWGARIDPLIELTEYVHTHISIKFIANRITRTNLFANLAEATPGLKEVMTLGRIWRWEQEQNQAGVPRFDMVIVDAPATGHGLSLLKQPGALLDMLHIGPIATQTSIVLDMLTNQKITGMVLVTLPEELPVKEALEFSMIAEQELKMPINLTVINSVFPRIFNQDECELIQTCRTDNCLMEPANWQIGHRNMQTNHITKLMTLAKGRVLQIPYYYTNTLSLAEIRKIANLLMGVNKQ